MATGAAWLSQRNTNLNTFRVTSITLNSTMISLGTSTNSVYTRLSQGNFNSSVSTSSWVSSLTGRLSTTTVAMSANAQYQLALSQSSISTSVMYTSTIGQTWSTLNGRLGLPNPNETSYTAGAVSGTGQYGVLGTSAGQLFVTSTFGQSFSGSSVNVPYVYLPFEGSITDRSGSNRTVTATGTFTYGTGIVGLYSAFFNNTSGNNTSSNYVSVPWIGAPNFTITGWFNASSFSSGGFTPTIFATYTDTIKATLSNTGVLTVIVPSNGASTTLATSPTLLLNTWYNYTFIFQTNGLCSYYLNNTLIGSITNVGGMGATATTFIYLGTNASAQNPFIGYMNDINIYTIAMPFTNLSSTTPVPTVYLPLDTVPAPNSQSSGTIPATLTVVGPPTQAPSYVVGTGAIRVANALGNVNATQYIRGSWSGATNFTVSFWFNTQLSTSSVLQQVIFSAYGTSITITINTLNQLVVAHPSGTGAGQTIQSTSFSIATNTWYNITFIFQTGNTCYLYVNNSLIIAFVNVGIGSFTSSAFGIGSFDVGPVVYGFNGYIDDFKIYNSAISLPPVSLTLPTSPTIYIPGDIAPIDGSQSLGTTPVTLTVIGQPTLASSYAAGLGAINLANTPTGTALQYIKGPWTAVPNFTVSLLINPQSAAASMIIFAIGGALQIQTNGTAGLQLQAPGISVSTAYAITANTWYNITVIFQANSVCSFYVNNVLIAQPTSTGSIPSGQFALGTYDTGTSNAFNGFIDDFRLYNTAIPLTTLFPTSSTMPAIHISGDTVPTTGSSSSGTAPVALTVTGTPTQAPSYVVGSGAINLANTAGSASPTQYIRGPWVVPPAFTISLWFNIQQLNGTYQVIFSALSVGIEIFIDPLNRLVGQIPAGSGAGQLNVNTAPLTTNIWYNAVLTYQVGGTSSMYLNNAFVGNFPVNTGLGTWGVTNTFALGTYDNSLNFAFNGYIDDVKIYNTIIPITNQFPSQPFTSIAVSNSGQYMLAAMTNQCLYMSSNYGTTFTPITGALLSALWSNAQISSSGQYMMAYAVPQLVSPQLTGLLGNTTSTTPVYISWTTNGITWTSFCSTNNNSASFQSWVAFNNIGTGSTVPYSWASNAIYTAGVYNGIVSTIIQNVGAYLGEWIQLQSSVPLVMYSYNFACGGTTNIPKTYYIVGSNDGITWYPIQSVSMNQTPFTNNFTSATSAPIIVNQSGIQTMFAGATGTLTCSTFATTNVAYTYFRFIANSLFSTGGNFELEELYLNFHAGGQTYSANYGSTWSNYMPLYTMIQPQLTGIPSSTTALTTAAWQTNGVTWIARASSLQASDPGNWPVSFAFDTTANAQWNSVDGYDSSGNPTIAPIKQTIVSGSTINGEWLQLESSTPLVMNSYKIGSGGFWQYPKSYTIAGSNDNGSTWFTVQTVTIASNPSGASNQLMPSTLIVVAQSGIQTVVTSAATANATCIPGANSTTAFTYFRIIAQSIFSNGLNSCVSIGDWVINFVGGTMSTHSLSESGQYQLTANATVSPALLTQLGFENTAIDSAGGLTYRSNVGSALSYSSSIYKVGTTSLFCNNVPSGATAVGGGALSYFNYTVPAALALPSALTISFWINPNSTAGQSCPIGFNNGGSAAGPYFYLASTMVFAYYTSTAQYGIVSGISTVPVGSWTHIALTFTNGLLALYINGTLQATLTVTGTLSLSSSGSWGAITNMFVGCIYTLGGGYQGYIDDIRMYTVALNTTQIYTLYATTVLTPAIYITQNFNINTLVLPTFTPALNASTNVPVASAVSNTGQYMIFITNNVTGSNVYYSMNYGATFTGLQLGTSVLTSCAMSYDGAYMTIASGATVYTLNNNSTGFSVALGNQAGAQNQALNSIAIGNYAGYQNQAASSIILNASGQSLNAISQGFYVSPIASYTASSAQTISLLGYGTDNQVVQTALTSASGNLTVPLGNLAVSSGNIIVPSGNLGVGTNAPGWALHVEGVIPMSGISGRWGQLNQYMPAQLVINNLPSGQRLYIGAYYTGGAGQVSVLQGSGIWDGTDHPTNISINPNGGNLGVGTAYPGPYKLDVSGPINCTGLLVNGTAVATGSGSVWTAGSGGVISYTGGNVGIGTTTPSTTLQLYGTSAAGGAVNQFIINTTTSGYAQIWLISGGNAGSAGGGLFMNGSTRSVDGGVNTLTLRNDAGDLKLAAPSDSPYIYLKAATGIGIGMNAPTNLLTVGPAVNPIANSAGTTQLVVYGNINCFRNRLIFSNALADWNHSIYNNANNVDNEGAWDGMKFNVYAGAWFRVGNASGVTPITSVFMNTLGNVGIGTTSPITTLHLYSTGPTGLFIATNTSALQLQLGIANAAGNYSEWAAIGDSVIRSNAGNLMLQSSSGGAAIYINTSNNVGIRTSNPTSTLHVNGSLAKSSGTFDIAHPLHPTTKRLVHSFIEGPRCDLIYRGTIALTNGVATVDINRQCTHNTVGAMEHGTFEALCANPDVFLQNRTGFGRVIGTIQGGTLTITCENNTATDLISWMVVAERADSFIKQWDRTDNDGYLITEYTQ